MSTLLDSVEARLRAQAQLLDLSPAQEARAHSLAVAGTVGALLGITPAQLYALLELGYEEWHRREQGHHRAAGESQVRA